MSSSGRQSADMITITLLTAFVGLVLASATVEQEFLSSIPVSDKVLLCFAVRDFSVTVTSESGFVPD